MAEVVKLRSASVADIPAMLRRMADDLESGRQQAEAALFIIPVEGEFPKIFGWGEHMGDYANIAVLEMAKACLIQTLVAES
jgi:hypothetical protein